MNRAAIALAALSNLMGGYANTKKEQRQSALDERKLSLQERALEEKSPSSGIAAVNFFEKKYNRPLKEDETMSLLSPAMLPPGDFRAYQGNPQGFSDFQKAKNPRPTINLGGEEPSRPAIRASEPNDAPPPEPGHTSEQRDEGMATGGGSGSAAEALAKRRKVKQGGASEGAMPSSSSVKIKLRRNPQTGALEAVQ